MGDVLVISARGFMGRAVSAALHRRGVGVVATDRSRDAVVCDVTDAIAVDEVIAAVRPRGVVVCAGAPHDGPPQDLYHVHVMGTLNVLEAVRRHVADAPVVLLGSAAEYGRVNPDRLPIREDEPCRPATLYGCSKLAQTQCAAAVTASWGLRVRTARLFNVVGPDMPPRFFFPALAARIRAAATAGVFSLRDAAATRDFIHVDDAAEAIAVLLDPACDDGIYNVATGVETSVIAAATVLGQCAGGIRALPEECADGGLRSVGDATKLRNLGWAPCRPWEQALAEVWQGVDRAA